MDAARSWWSAVLLSTAFSACLFPDYRTAEQSGGSAGSSGATGGAGNGGTEGGSGGTAGGNGGTGGGSGGAEGGSGGAEGGSGGTAGGNGGTGGGSGGTAGADGGSAGTTNDDGSAGTGGTGGSGGSCAPGACAEQCGNGADDDGDTRVDCFDTDCADAVACIGRCSDAAELPCDVVRAGARSDAAGSTLRIAKPNYGCAPAQYAGPEFAYRFSGDTDRQVFVELYGLDADLDVILVDVPAGGACNAFSGCKTAGDANTDLKAEILTFHSLPGRDYYLIVDGPNAAAYSISAACSTPTGCWPSRPIEAGQTLSGSNTPGVSNVTQKVTTYSCAIGNRAAPEASFMFAPTETGVYDVRLTGLSTNLDLFVLPGKNCDGTCLPSTLPGINNARADELVSFTGNANMSYFIVVDGTSQGNFTLSVTKR